MEALSWSSSGTFELMLLLMLIYSMINHYKFQLVKLIILYAAGCKRCYRQCLYFYPKLYDACYFRWVKYIHVYSGSLKNLKLWPCTIGTKGILHAYFFFKSVIWEMHIKHNFFGRFLSSLWHKAWSNMLLQTLWDHLSLKEANEISH